MSVVIPTKNGGALFSDVLQELRRQKEVELDLVIVDSGSKDETLAYARGAGARILTIPPESFNHGATRDLGLREVRSDLAVLMTQDALPGDPWMLARLAQAFEDEQVGGAYVRQVARPEADVLTRRNLELALTGRLQSET